MSETKEQAKHTLGPWTANWSTATNGGPERGWFVESESDRDAYGAIAELPDGREETKANARLIAAAPELLEACKRAIELLKGAGANVDEDEPILSAIAKAEGRP